MITNGENIVKTRYIDEKSNQQILRVDIENDVKPFKGNMPKEILMHWLYLIMIRIYNISTTI